MKNLLTTFLLLILTNLTYAQDIPYLQMVNLPETSNEILVSNGLRFNKVTLGSEFNVSGGTISLASGISSPWTVSGSNIYRNTGNVGIGTTSPLAGLDIQKNIATTNGGMNMDVAIRAYNTAGTGLLQLGTSTTGADAMIQAVTTNGNLILGTRNGEALRLNSTNTVSLTSLSGVGTRLVTTSSTGLLGSGVDVNTIYSTSNPQPYSVNGPWRVSGNDIIRDVGTVITNGNHLRSGNSLYHVTLGNGLVNSGSAYPFVSTSNAADLTLGINSRVGSDRKLRANVTHPFLGSAIVLSGASHPLGTNSVLFYTNGGSVVADQDLSSRLSMSITGDKVGIGTTNPIEKLHVDGNFLVKNTAGQVVHTLENSTSDRLKTLINSSNALLFTEGDVGLNFDTKATLDFAQLQLRTNGNVTANTVTGNFGIGTTSPYAKLSISGGSNVVPSLSFGNSAFGWKIFERLTDGDLQIKRTNSSVDDDVMYFDRSSGNVGIGTEAPSEKLEVLGKVIATSIITDYPASTIIDYGTGYTFSSSARSGMTAFNPNVGGSSAYSSLVFYTTGFTGANVVREPVLQLNGGTSGFKQAIFRGGVVVDNLAGVGTRMVTASSTGLLSTTAIPTASNWSTFPATSNVAMGTNRIGNTGSSGLSFPSTVTARIDATNTSLRFGSGGLNLNVSPNVWSLVGVEGGSIAHNNTGETLTFSAKSGHDFIVDDVGLILPEYSTGGSIEDGTLYRDETTGRLKWYDPDLVQDEEVAMLSDTDPDHVLLTTATAISQVVRNVFIDVSSATTHNLSPASNFVDKYVTIMNVSATANITLDPFGSETIDGGSNNIVLGPNEAITVTNFTGSSDIKVISRN